MSAGRKGEKQNGTALAAPQNAGIEDILQHPLDRRGVPILARAVLNALGVEMVGDPLGTVALVCGEPEDRMYDKRLFLTDRKVKNLLLPPVGAPSLDILVTIRAKAAGKTALLCQDAHAVRSAGGDLLALAVSLPVADIVRQAVGMAFNALFPL